MGQKTGGTKLRRQGKHTYSIHRYAANKSRHLLKRLTKARQYGRLAEIADLERALQRLSTLRIV